MSRFLLATMGSLGDLHPSIAIGRVLLARGHRVIIVSAEEYRSAVQKVGIEFAAAPPSLAELGDYQKVVARIFHARRGPERLIREMVMPSLRSAYQAILQASEGADLLVSHPLTFAVQLVAQRRGLPWVATVLSPLSFMSDYDPPIISGAPWLRKLRAFGPKFYGTLFSLFKKATWRWEAPLRQLRKELGLPPSMHMAMFEGQFSPLLNLALFDPPLAQPQPDWPANIHVCGSPMFEGAMPDENTLLELNRFLAKGDPPIVFALGSSAVWVAGDFWERTVHVTQQLGRRAILLTGPAMPASLPESVKAFSYLPYSKVFPHAAAVVHQGGIGTLAQALRAGRPQLIVPLAFDQPDNAQRAKELGLARVIPFRKATSRRLAIELEPLLSCSNYASAAAKIANDLVKVDGASCAADHLVNCLGKP